MTSEIRLEGSDVETNTFHRADGAQRSAMQNDSHEVGSSMVSSNGTGLRACVRKSGMALMIFHDRRLRGELWVSVLLFVKKC